ncbi:MAG: hypothetical protein JW993_06275 [Sedimentisphaerales bacterium]|nr:hypothetical protein [Sedimentisphaerales bacterium]
MTREIFSEGVAWLLLAQCTVCLAAGMAGSYLLRRYAARAHQVLLTGLLASALVPATYLLARHLGLGVLPPQAATLYDAQPGSFVINDVTVESPPAVAVASQASVAELPESPAPGPAHTAPAPRIPWVAILLWAWALGTTLLLTRLLLRFSLGLHLLRRAEPVETPALRDALCAARERAGIATPVELRSSERVRSPIIWCWRRVPVLLVHHTARDREARDWAAVFCHELAHWKRLDHVSGLWAELLVAALPWHPLAWWAKGRLSRLSEEVCDDWVLASGHIGVDYAESLLDLAPQNQPAFVPTVVGKERAMKERIRRIVKDRCANPTTGKRWTLGVTVLVIGVAATVAFAQPGRAPREPGDPRPFAEPDQRPPRDQALVLEGRRNVLERMLDQLRGQVRKTETLLSEEREMPAERRQLLRAESAALRNQIAQTERQLANLNQPAQDRPPTAARPMMERARLENARLLDLRAKAEETRRALSGIDDADSRRAQELRESLEATEQQIHAAEVQLDRLRQRVAQARDQASEAQSPARERRRQMVEELEPVRREAAEAQRRRNRANQVRQRMEDIEVRLMELREQGMSDSEENEALRDELHALRIGSPGIEQAIPGPRARARATAAPRPALRQRRAQLQEEMAAVEQRLAQLENQNGDEAGQLRRRLEELHAALEQIGRAAASAQATAPRRPVAGSAREAEAVPPARARAAATRMPQLRAQREVSQARAAALEERLAQLENKDGEEAARLREMLKNQRAEIERIDRELSAAQPIPLMRPAAGRALEAEIEELRGQVNGLNEQMQEMQNLLRRLLAQRERSEQVQN